MAKKKATEIPAHITPDDLENRFRALQGGIQGRVDDQKSTIATVAAGGGLVLLLIIFFLGKRSGKKKSTVVEIRRI